MPLQRPSRTIWKQRRPGTRYLPHPIFAGIPMSWSRRERLRDPYAKGIPHSWPICSPRAPSDHDQSPLPWTGMCLRTVSASRQVISHRTFTILPQTFASASAGSKQS